MFKQFPDWTKLRINLVGRRLQYYAGFTGILGIISSEMHFGWPSPYLPILTSNHTTNEPISHETASWLAIINQFGIIIGGMITLFITNKVGRRPLIHLASVPLFITWLAIGLAYQEDHQQSNGPSKRFMNKTLILFVARFVAGIADGTIFTVVPMYLSEISEPEIRGRISSLTPLSIVFGLLLINVLGAYFSISTSAYIAIIFPLILFVSFRQCPPSPYFLVMQGKCKEARKSLSKLRGNSTNVDEELKRIVEVVQEEKKSSRNILDLFTIRANRSAFFIVIGLRTIQQLSGYSAFVFYCNTIFMNSGHFISPENGSMVFFALQMIFVIISYNFVDRTGRRPLLLISTAGIFIVLLLNSIYFYFKNCTSIDLGVFGLDFVPLVMMVFFILFFSIGLQTIPIVIMSEMFATSVKVMGMGLTELYFSILVIVMSKFFDETLYKIGLHLPLFVFSVCSAFGFGFIWMWVPETKKRTLEDIQGILKEEIK